MDTMLKIEEDVLGGGAWKILVVDDEPYVLRAIQRLLKSRDADVLTAPNGLQAIQMLKRNEQVAVVISDQFMPGMGGAELLEHIRQDYPDIVRVMLTGNNDLATAVEAINRGIGSAHEASFCAR